MFAVTVRDHMMVAHSFRGEVFGPGADCTARPSWWTQHFVAKILTPTTWSSTSAPPQLLCTRYLADLSYRNLDDDADFAGINTTTEFLARVVADRLADRIAAGELGAAATEIAGLQVTLHESHVASASYERAL